MKTEIEMPKKKAPKGKKWWWRPVYYMTIGGAEGFKTTCNCAFCGKNYDNHIPAKCECGAIIYKGEQFGLMPKDYNEVEVWA